METTVKRTKRVCITCPSITGNDVAGKMMRLESRLRQRFSKVNYYGWAHDLYATKIFVQSSVPMLVVSLRQLIRESLFTECVLATFDKPYDIVSSTGTFKPYRSGRIKLINTDNSVPISNDDDDYCSDDPVESEAGEVENNELIDNSVDMRIEQMNREQLYNEVIRLRLVQHVQAQPQRQKLDMGTVHNYGEETTSHITAADVTEIVTVHMAAREELQFLEMTMDWAKKIYENRANHNIKCSDRHSSAKFLVDSKWMIAPRRELMVSTVSRLAGLLSSLGENYGNSGEVSIEVAVKTVTQAALISQSMKYAREKDKSLTMIIHNSRK